LIIPFASTIAQAAGGLRPGFDGQRGLRAAVITFVLGRRHSCALIVDVHLRRCRGDAEALRCEAGASHSSLASTDDDDTTLRVEVRLPNQ